VAPPTSEQVGEISLSATPFAVSYDIASGTAPTQEQYIEAAELTIDYIETTVRSAFDQNPSFTLESFNFEVLGNSMENVPPYRIGYAVMVSFFDTSGVPPDQSAIDNLIRNSFQQPQVQDLLDEFIGLDFENPFAETTGVTYSDVDVPAIEESAATATTITDAVETMDSGSASLLPIIVAVAAAVTALGSVLWLYTTGRFQRILSSSRRNNRKGQNDEVIFSEDHNLSDQPNSFDATDDKFSVISDMTGFSSTQDESRTRDASTSASTSDESADGWSTAESRSVFTTESSLLDELAVIKE